MVGVLLLIIWLVGLNAAVFYCLIWCYSGLLAVSFVPWCIRYCRHAFVNVVLHEKNAMRSNLLVRWFDPCTFCRFIEEFTRAESWTKFRSNSVGIIRSSANPFRCANLLANLLRGPLGRSWGLLSRRFVSGKSGHLTSLLVHKLTALFVFWCLLHGWVRPCPSNLLRQVTSWRRLMKMIALCRGHYDPYLRSSPIPRLCIFVLFLMIEALLLVRQAITAGQIVVECLEAPRRPICRLEVSVSCLLNTTKAAATSNPCRLMVLYQQIFVEHWRFSLLQRGCHDRRSLAEVEALLTLYVLPQYPLAKVLRLPVQGELLPARRLLLSRILRLVASFLAAEAGGPLRSFQHERLVFWSIASLWIPGFLVLLV